jgi:hypothetical protein
MAGAEGECRLDFNADAIWPCRGAVVRAVNDETPSPDRLEHGKAFANPIGGFDLLEAERPGRCGSGGRCHRRADAVSVGRGGCMNGQAPLAG